ncbi:membrane-spanning 4-domains subfamily A member 6A isoform X2 [Perognathus longimembris pacificus]|uniref:membrane-spanning 4-domains subfamily A member 6A isoform X2 n=1 Tax=Perognathus longimembris pacificus TaxID=214514 RepID=UPI002019F5D5|nr:membrane-spanning 4-domains subfamily A member 6A isoform X2 [Perognathus longimembris pacificus]
MIPQVVTRETVTVIRSNGTIFDQPQPTHQMDYSLKKYILDEIKVIGAIQILCAIMVLIFGILLACAPFSPDFTPVFSSLIKSGYPFVGPVCVHSSLALSIVSTLFGLLGFILLSLNLSVMDPAVHKCELTIPPTESSYHYYHWSRYNECYMTKISLAGVLGLMLVCTLVELGLAVLSVVLWWIQSNSDFPGRVHFVSQTSYDKLNFSNQEISQNTYEELLKN